MDPEDKVSKIFCYIFTVCLTGSGMIFIQADAHQKQNESIWNRC